MDNLYYDQKKSEAASGYSVWDCIAKGTGTAARLAAAGFTGAIAGGIRLTAEVIIPAAVKGAGDAVIWSRGKDKN